MIDVCIQYYIKADLYDLILCAFVFFLSTFLSRPLTDFDVILNIENQV